MTDTGSIFYCHYYIRMMTKKRKNTNIAAGIYSKDLNEEIQTSNKLKYVQMSKK